jgi:DNA recombination protein RmuC
MDDLGKRLTSAVMAYNGTVGSFEKNVLVSARKLNALEIVDYELDPPTPVDEPVRTLGAPELVTAAEEARAVVALPAIVIPDAEGTSALADLDGRTDDYGIDAGAPTMPDTRGRRTGS